MNPSSEPSPAIIFVPGLDGTGLLFYRQTRHLQSRYQVITYRLRDEAPDMAALVADLVATLDARVGPGTAVTMVGESFGGALAMSFALAHPERVERLVILNSFSRITPRFKLFAGMAAVSLVPWRTMHWVRTLTAWRLHSSHTHPEDIRAFFVLTRAATRTGYWHRLRILTRYDVRPHLPQLRVPTLFLAADADHLIPSVREARLMASLAPMAWVRILEGHGHCTFLAPDIDLATILDDWRDLVHLASPAATLP